MKRILVDARLAWGSGIGRYVRNVVPAVARAMPDVAFVIRHGADSGGYAKQLMSGIDNVELELSETSPFSLREQFEGLIRREPYDLLWFTNYWVPLGITQPYVAVIFDLLHLEAELFPASWVKRSLAQLTFANVAKSADTLFFISNFSQSEFERRFESRAQHIMSSLGVDHDQSVRANESVPAKVPRVLIVAAAKVHKNFSLAVRAFRRATIMPHWTLTIISPADILRSSIDLEALVAGDPRIEVRRGVSDIELQTLYQESAILLMPSRYEGFGLPLAEGMLAGAVCISSTAPALREIAGDAPVAFVDPLDEAGWASEIERQCARFDAGLVPESERLAGIERAAQFSWKPVVDATVVGLRRALERN